MNIVIELYDWMLHHRRWLMLIVSVVTIGLLVLASRLRYHEDIFDFIPQDDSYTESMQVYASLSEASRIVVIFDGDNPDSIIEAIDAFSEACPGAITEMDLDGYLSRMEYIYAHLPYFMDSSAYARLDVACHSWDTIQAVMQENREMMGMAGSSVLASCIAADPIHLIPFSYGVSGQYSGAQSAFISYNGYMMTADHRIGFAFYDSPYGSTETARNAALMDTLIECVNKVECLHPNVDMRLLGGPCVAVENAKRIKVDSAIAIGVSMVLIMLLLLYSFPRKRDILLIGISIGFGWLTGMAALSVFVGTVSVIVLGIGSILIGIAVNYPLHLLTHHRYTHSVRQTLQEVLSPLVIGNITTIGAFAAMIPLPSPALCQLGIFASAMFLGTIVFCIFVLPHLMNEQATPIREIHLPWIEKWMHAHSGWNRNLSYAIVLVVVGVGIYVAIEKPNLFDSNLSHINYMTPQQREDFAWIASLSHVSNRQKYTAATAREELRAREKRWAAFWQEHNRDSLVYNVQRAGIHTGFREDAFIPFVNTLYQDVPHEDLNQSSTLARLWPGGFDMEAMNRYVTESLTRHFDYIGLVCSLIVLLFLCISFRSVVLGFIAFVPMLLSWGVIMALMQCLGLQFNIVNVILATFIFGQGDDYTIFVVEGLLNEQRYGKQITDQYRQSILLSALVMLMAIGVLVFARHPAMHSLGMVTWIGMTTVVCLANVVPPILFQLLHRLGWKKICKV